MEGAGTPASGEIGSAGTFAAGPPVRRFVEIGATRQGRMGVERQETTTGWTVTRKKLGSGGGSVAPVTREQHLIKLDDGSVAIADELVFDEEVRVVFEPPMIVMPARLVAGQEFKQTTRMTVHPLNDGQKIKARGMTESTITFVGRERVRTPAGMFDASHIRHTFIAALSPARVTNSTDRWYADELGLIAEKRTERTTVGGIQIRSNAEEWVVETK